MSRGTVPRAQPVLASERLTLAPLVPGHTEGLVALFADPRASRYFPVDFSDERAARDLVAGRLAYAGPPELGTGHGCWTGRWSGWDTCNRRGTCPAG